MAEPFAEKRPNTPRIKIIQVGPDEYLVESSKGKICYRVMFTPQGHQCTCGDFTSNINQNPNYTCKHILQILNWEGPVPHVEGNEPSRPRVDDRFLTNIQGKDFVLYAGLLDLAHQKGIRRIQVEAVQYPAEANGFEAICRAEVESPFGELYVEYGDASPQNVNKKIAPHVLRMAATRAKARAMRDYTNIGITCLEELGDLDDVVGDDEPRKRNQENVVPFSGNRSKTTRTRKSSKPVEPDRPNPQEQPQARQEPKQEPKTKTSPGPSAAQLKAMENLAKRRGITNEELEDMAQTMFGTSYLNINASEAANLIRSLQQSG